MKILVSALKTDLVLGRRYANGVQFFSTDILGDVCPGDWNLNLASTLAAKNTCIRCWTIYNMVCTPK